MKLDRPLNLTFSDETSSESEAAASAGDSEHRKQLMELGEKIKKLEAERNELRKKLDGEQQKNKQYSGDAQIDSFLIDIAPYFYKKKLTYVDIGAYTGEVFQKVYESEILDIREAHLFEPNPESYKAIEARLKSIENIEKLHALHTYNFALGICLGEARFYSAKSMTKKVEDGEDVGGSFTVKVKTLDEQIENITDKHIHLLKIDVEGGEIDVIQGAELVLTGQLVDVIYIEVGFNINGKQQVYIGEVDSLLQSFGYRAFRIYEQKNEWIEDSPLLRRCNLAYFSKSFAEKSPYLLTREVQSLRKKVDVLSRK